MMDKQSIGFRASHLLRSRIHAAAQDKGMTVTQFMRNAMEEALKHQGFENANEAKSTELVTIEQVAQLCRAVLVLTSSLEINTMVNKESILARAENAMLGAKVLKARLEKGTV